jgi:hypothetical protein
LQAACLSGVAFWICAWKLPAPVVKVVAFAAIAMVPSSNAVAVNVIVSLRIESSCVSVVIAE